LRQKLVDRKVEICDLNRSALWLRYERQVLEPTERWVVVLDGGCGSGLSKALRQTQCAQIAGRRHRVCSFFSFCRPI